MVVQPTTTSSGSASAEAAAAAASAAAPGVRKVWYAPNGFEAYGEAEIQAVDQCLRDGWLAGFGKRTVEFENRVAAMFGKRFALFVNSGSSACLLALASLDLPKGSEVVTPACTFSTTVAPIIQLGLKPVFCDVSAETYLPTVEQIVGVVTAETRAVMIPNLIGNLPDWTGLREALAAAGREDVVLIEDSADTIGHAPQGTDISTTSFYASHVITACGSGGMVMFNDEAHLKRASMMRDWGRIGTNSEEVRERFAHEVDGIPYDFKFLYGALGYNFKSSEVNAAFGLVQLDRLEENLAIRKRNFERYLANLEDLSAKGLLQLPPPDSSVHWLAIPFQCPAGKRLGLLSFLEENHVQTRVTFSGNITRHPIYREYLADYPNSDKIMSDGFLLGCHHGMAEEDVDYVCAMMRRFFELDAAKGAAEQP
jgi:CDP-6-deoxy-D-xylo-4-hexulose-3-dehydrase